MLANLSFRTKLLSLLITAIVGFIIVTFVAIQGLALLKNTNNQLRTLSKIQASNDILIIDMLEISDALQNVKADEYDTKIAQLKKQLKDSKPFIQNSINTTKSTDLKTALQKMQTLTEQFGADLLSLMETRHLIGLDAASGLRGKINELGTKITQDVKSLSLLRREFTNVRKAESGLLFEPSEENFQEFIKSYDRFDTRIENFGLQDKFGQITSEYKDSILNYKEQGIKLASHLDAFATQKALFSEGQADANKLIEKAVQNAEKISEDSSAQANATLLIVSIVVALIALLLMFTITRNVKSTLINIIYDLNKVKAGNMTAKAVVNAKRNDEFDQLSQSLNQMTDGLGNVLKDVVMTTDTVNGMSTDLNTSIEKITKNNHLVNNRTRSLAKATDDISNRITELSSTTEKLSLDSNETYTAAKSGAETIRTVLDSLNDTISVVNTTSQQLNELGQLSNDIDSVLGMINDLASQTNLLALNAAIEAARAGEAGRGFSVVADEVRTLAEKTVDATAKITDIVSTIQNSTQSAIITMESGQNSLKIIEENGSTAENAMRSIEAHALTSSDSANSMATSIQDVASTAIQMSKEMEEIAQQLNEDSSSIDLMADKTQHIQELAKQLSEKTKVFTLA